MPYVNIRVTKEGVTAKQKEQLIEGATKLLQEVLGKPPQSTFVVIDEVETDNWGVGGETVTVLRKRGDKDFSKIYAEFNNRGGWLNAEDSIRPLNISRMETKFKKGEGIWEYVP